MFHVEHDDIQQYETLYPNIDVKQQLNELAAWNQANPTRRKTRAGIKRHINSWMKKANQEGQPSGIPGQFTPGPWAQVANAYFRPLRTDEVQAWESEFLAMLSPAPAGQEIITAIRSIVSDPQGKPAYLDAWMIIRTIRATRKAATAADLTQTDIQAYVDSIEAEKDLLTRWDMICDHANPMKIEAALNQANIAFARPTNAIKEAQDNANFSFRVI